MSLLLLFNTGFAPSNITGAALHTLHHIGTGAVSLSGPSPTPDTDGMYVEIAFTNNPGTAQSAMTWVDVTPDVFSDDGVQARYGRSTELDTFQGGTASFVLTNEDRAYDPEYASSPHAGRLLPLRPVRIRFVRSLVSYPLFCGFVTGWPQTYQHPSSAKSRIDCVDGFRLLQAAAFDRGYFTLDSTTLGVLDKNRLGTGSAGVTAELSGARVSTILDIAQWPTADRIVDVGSATIDADQQANSALASIQSAVDGEFGQFYLDPQGKAVFEDRHHRITATRSKSSQATFGDGPGQIPYTGIVYDYSEKLIANDVTRSNNDSSVTAQARDETSIATYLRHVDQKSVPVSQPNDLQALAQAVLGRYKDPQLRIDSLTFDHVAPGSAAHNVLVAARISDRVTVERRPQNVGAAISHDLWVEGIAVEHHSLNDWSWTLNLSPADSVTYLTLDDVTLGKLDLNHLAA